MIDPDTGLPADPATADYIKIINSKNETLRADVTEKQVDLALRALEQVEPNKNNTYTVNENIKGDLPTIKALLLKPENAGIADDFYKKMANKFRDSDQLMNDNPNFVKRNNGADYQQMSSEFENVTARRMQFDNVISQGNQIYLDNFTKVLKTELNDDVKNVKRDLDLGAPKIIKTNSANALDFQSEAEFVADYIALAKSGKLKNPNPTGWFGLGGNGANENFQVTYTKYDTDRGMIKVGPGEYEYPSRRVTEFSDTKAKEAAKAAYARQKGLINDTLNGSLETQAEQEGVKTGQTRMFQPWDPYQYVRGKSLNDMNTGDALKNPFY